MENKILYLFDYKMVFSFQNNPKNLDPSSKMETLSYSQINTVQHFQDHNRNVT